MKVDLNKIEIDFIAQCVYMSAREGFYHLDCSDLHYDHEEVGNNLLKKLGMNEKIINEYMSGF